MPDDQDQASLTPTTLIIFGITGDLSQRYLLPALYHLTKDNGLHPNTRIVGVTRRDVTVDQLFNDVEICVNEVDNICDPEALKNMRERTEMLTLDLDDQESYNKLANRLNSIEDEQGVCMNRVFYLSIPPQVYSDIIQRIGAANLNKSCQHGTGQSRLMVEKPFGYDLQSARELIEVTDSVFAESQVFRIDHFLAKQSVRRIVDFRYANPYLESIWNSNNVSSMEISASESIGIEGRVHFYEPLGALRDFVQNHLLQIASMLLMDLPNELTSEALHQAKSDALSAIDEVLINEHDSARRGQYQGYLEEVNNPTSTTETYAEIQVNSHSERWNGTKLRIWTGKAMSDKRYQVIVNFGNSDTSHTKLVFHLQPDMGVELIADQASGFGANGALRSLQLTKPEKQDKYPNAYEAVISAAIAGDSSLFASSQGVINSWRIIQPVVAAWGQNSEAMITYPQGSPGPLKP